MFQTTHLAPALVPVQHHIGVNEWLFLVLLKNMATMDQS